MILICFDFNVSFQDWMSMAISSYFTGFFGWFRGNLVGFDVPFQEISFPEGRNHQWGLDALISCKCQQTFIIRVINFTCFSIWTLTVGEVGMLNCGFTEQDPICVPDSGKYPAKDAPDFGILAYASKTKRVLHAFYWLSIIWIYASGVFHIAIYSYIINLPMQLRRMLNLHFKHEFKGWDQSLCFRSATAISFLGKSDGIMQEAQVSNDMQSRQSQAVHQTKSCQMVWLRSSRTWWSDLAEPMSMDSNWWRSMFAKPSWAYYHCFMLGFWRIQIAAYKNTWFAFCMLWFTYTRCS